MNLVKDISLKDPKLTLPLNIISVVLIVVVWLPKFKYFLGGWGLFILPAMVLMVPLHEALHGILFKVWGKTVKFGYTNSAMGPSFYATSEGSRFTRRQFIAICLLPQIVTLVCLPLALLLPLQIWAMALLLSIAGFNLGGGIADLYIVEELLKLKGDIKVEDYIAGVKVYG